MKTLINKLIEHKFKPSTIIKVYRVYNKIKAIISRFNPLIYTRVIKGLVKDVKLLRSNLVIQSKEIKEMNNRLINIKKDVDVSRCEGLINKDSIEINKSDINCLSNKLNNYKDRLNMLRGDINLNKSSINQLSHEAKSYVNDDDLQDKLYDFKHQHITPIEDVISNNDKTIFNKVDMNERRIKVLKNKMIYLKEHIKSVETLVNELCELNQIKERI